MRTAITAVIVAVLISSTSATASFVATAKNRVSGTIHPAGLSAGKPRISWADTKHRFGWVVSGPRQRRYCGRGRTVLCATEDGGKHWRVVLRYPNNMFGYLRWSKKAGVVSIGAYGHGELWTRDGGRHWWGTSALQLGGYESYGGFGAGPRFFVARGADGRRQLRYAYAPRWPYRVVGSFPTRPLECAGQWTRSYGIEIGPKNVCYAGPVGGDGLRAEPAGPAARLAVALESAAGEGLVRSNPVGIDCGMVTRPNAVPYRGTVCAAPFWMGSTLTLRAFVIERPYDLDVHWTGCSRVYAPNPGAAPWCEVALAGDALVTATLRRP